MKIQCDVCHKDEASVFCSADEAALCAACDHRVHHANKLAGKHHRFSLLHPSPKQFPLCDICQNKRAFLFCQQDRAILCRDCDAPIHEANEHTQNHNRFLLTGVKISALTEDRINPVPNLRNSQNPTNKPVSVLEPSISNSPTTTTTAKTAADSGGSTSSISEYLIEMLPGWRVDDFLDSSPPSSGFSKSVDEVFPSWDGHLETNLCSFSSPKNMGIWVPQAPPTLFPNQCPSSNIEFGGQVGFKGPINYKKLSSKKWRDDGAFTVPQISPPTSISASKKRSRAFW